MGSGSEEELGNGGARPPTFERFLATLLGWAITIVDFNGQVVKDLGVVVAYKQPTPDVLIVVTKLGFTEKYDVPPGCVVVAQ